MRLISSVHVLVVSSVVAGCVVEKQHGDGAPASTTDTTTGGDSTAASTAADPTTTGTGETGIVGDTGDSSETGVDASSSSDTGGSDTGGGVQHAACAAPFPQPAPPLPHVNFAGDVPTFALWQALGCEDPAVSGAPTCAQDGECASGNCVDFTGDAGVCSHADIDVWCDGEGEAMGTADGSCWICLEPFEHAQACCEHPDGQFDCRQWPFAAAPGIVGQVCATHDDCEPGLACSEPYWVHDFLPSGGFCDADEDCDDGEICDEDHDQCGVSQPHFAGYGICACPGTPSDTIVPGPACFE